MTPGALATRERVRPPSMTRVIASLCELGFVARTAHPADGRQVLVSVSRAGADLIEAERRASQEWLKRRLARLEPDQRKTLLVAADLMSAHRRRKRVSGRWPNVRSTSPTPPTRGSTTSATSTAWTAGPTCPAARVW